MPYIRIKAYPKEEEARKKLVEAVNQAVMDALGCPAKAITISLEEVAPEDWQEKVVKAEIEPNDDKMMIRSGEKRY